MNTHHDAGIALQTLLRRPRVQGNFDHYYEGVAVAFDSGKNLAFTQAAATVPPHLSAHSQRMGQKIYCVAQRVYCAVGYALANVIFVVGDSGIVVMDCTESLESAQACLADFKRACPAAAALRGSASATLGGRVRPRGQGRGAGPADGATASRPG